MAQAPFWGGGFPLSEDLDYHIDRLSRQRPHAKEALDAYKDLLACLKDAEPSLENITVEGSFELQGQRFPIKAVQIPVQARSLMESKTEFDFGV